MKIREATEKDCRDVYRIICGMESKELPYEPFEQIFRKQCADPDYVCLLCEEEGRVIAELNLRFEEQLHHTARIAEIMEFGVSDGYRSQGIGRDMFAAACEAAKEAGCVQIEVACNQLRKDAHRFYQREGMKNFHFKFSKSLTGDDPSENFLGR